MEIELIILFGAQIVTNPAPDRYAAFAAKDAAPKYCFDPAMIKTFPKFPL